MNAKGGFGALVAVCLLVAGCGGSPWSSSSTPTTMRYCRTTDLSGTVAPMPTPGRLDTARSYAQLGIRLDPAPSGAAPSITADRAWNGIDGITGVDGLPLGGAAPQSGSYILVLALITAHPSAVAGMAQPQTDRTLAWVVIGSHVPIPQPPPFGASGTPAQWPPCIWGDSLAAVDATTGRSLYQMQFVDDPTAVRQP